MSTSTASSNKPVHRIKYGRITGTIWQNQTEQRGPMFNVTIARSYQDDKKNWHDSQSFGLADLLIVAKIALDAHTWISTQRAQGESSSARGNGSGNRSARRQSTAQ